jgi:hypothetical protein
MSTAWVHAASPHSPMPSSREASRSIKGVPTAASAGHPPAAAAASSYGLKAVATCCPAFDEHAGPQSRIYTEPKEDVPGIG